MNTRSKLYTAFTALVIAAAALYYASKTFTGVSEIRYAGSKECARCHESIYARWKNTLHAKALMQSAEIFLLPESSAMAEKHISIGESAEAEFAIGNHWTRRYLLSNKRVSPFLYSLVSGGFSDYFDKNYKRSDYERECIGCHTTGAAVSFPGVKDGGRIRYAEAGVACEACHGPASAHIEYSDTRYVVNPKKLDPDKRDMICMSCHTNGYDKSGEYKFALGYKPGKDLQDHFFNMVPKPGQLKYNVGSRFDYAADNSLDDRKRQFEYWKFMFLAKEGFSCEDCLDFRGAAPKAEKKSREFASPPGAAVKDEGPGFFSVNEYCMSCHASLPPFLQYASGSQEAGLTASKCEFINKKMRLDDKSAEASCASCHKSESVHDHFFIVNGER